MHKCQLQCCTDYHSYFSEPKSYVQESCNQPFEWDSSLNALLCACSEQEASIPDVSGRHFKPSNNYPQRHPDTVHPNLLPLNSPRPFSPTISPPPRIQDFPPPLNASRSLTSPPDSVLNCMWGTCRATFSSLSELVGHVNVHHLRLPSQSVPTHTLFDEPPRPPQSQQQESAFGSLSCLWENCNMYPSINPVPGPSSRNQVDSALDILANHLLQDHLGFSTRAPVLVGSSNAPLMEPDQLPCIPTPAPSPSPSLLPFPNLPPHECSGTHVCKWKSCDQLFSSCEELTDHITAVHVGAGKARYECFWGDCPRHGDHGFASKQKICRHLQVGSRFLLPYPLVLNLNGAVFLVVSYRPSTVPV